MFTSLLERIHRFLTHPQLAWILLWLGLAFLIVALAVMIRTSWGQSHPLRKCAGLSLLAHLLLLCYATTVHIVTATGNGHQGGMSLLLVDGAADGSDFGDEDGADNASEPFIEGSGEHIPSVGAIDNSHEILEREAGSTGGLRAAVVAPATKAHMVPPLLEVAAEPLPKKEQPVEPSAPAKVAVNPTPTVPPATAPAEPPPPQVTAEDSPANDKPAEPLSSNAPPAPLAKLPEPPVTSESSEWVAGDPTGSSLPHQPAPTGPLTDVANLPTAEKAPDATPADTQPPAINQNIIRFREPAVANAAAQNPNANSGLLSPVVSGPLVENITGPIAAHPVPEIYSDRVSPDRAEITRRRGGSPSSESCVQAALSWLALHQSADGRWDADKFGAGRETGALGQDRQGAGARADTAVTGLALLAFLGAGNTHVRGDYAQNVQRGLEFLLSSQSKDGNLAGSAETYAFMYSHGMATLALSEAYAMTGDRRLLGPVQAAIDYTLSAQLRSTGGWRYRAVESPGERGDTSQLGWQLMSLKSAELAGINVPATAADGAVRYLKTVSSGQYGGRASYRPGERPSRTMTAEALVCRQFLGMARDNPASDEAGEYVLSDLPTTERINLYYWYYATLGMYQLQGEQWQRWNEALQATLVSRQRADGDLAGSWDPECVWGGYGGRVYSTSLSALCLEIYYRYLPIYRVASRAQSAADSR